MNPSPHCSHRPSVCCVAARLAVLFACCTTIGLVSPGLSAAPAADEKTGRPTAYVLPITGPIDKGMLYVFRRAFRQAEAQKPDAIVIDLDTPGGGLRETNEIIAWIRAVRKKNHTKILAFVNPNALSAGAIISLGSDAIYMAPSGSIGSAMPIAMSPIGGGVQQLPADVKEKMMSAVRAMVRGLAQENGYSVEIAEAMVDAEKEVVVGDRIVCPEGELLNLTGREAVEIIPPNHKPLLAIALVDSIPDLLDHAGLAGAEITRFEEESAERLARWITAIGPLLLALGVLGLYIEFKTPGFGLPGIAGLSLLSIYFFGHYVAGLAGREELFLVVLGLILLAVEIFVIPGFGVVGLLGIVCMFGGCLLVLMPYIPDVSPIPGAPEFGYSGALDGALLEFSITVGIVAFGAWALGKILPKTSIYRAAVLQGGLSRSQGYVASDVTKYMGFLNQTGVALTALRPAGTASFGDERLDVVSSGDMIPRDSVIRVVEVEGGRIVVEQHVAEKPPVTEVSKVAADASERPLKPPESPQTA